MQRKLSSKKKKPRKTKRCFYIGLNIIIYSVTDLF